ncbi:hypothetical protein H0H92_014666, partial [Tricholoma furcatifolium]
MAPSNAGGADKKKGKDKTPAEPKKSTRMTRQTSSIIEQDTALGDSAGDDDVVDYGYSDMPDLATGGSGVRISVVPASSSRNDIEEPGRPTTGTTLDTADDEYLSPDTEEALAANVLSGGDTEGEDESHQPNDALDPEDLTYAVEYAGQNTLSGVPSTPAANSGRRAERTPASVERPAKRTRERSQQSPWHPAQPASIFPIDRAQVVAERASGTIHATPT